MALHPAAPARRFGGANRSDSSPRHSMAPTVVRGHGMEPVTDLLAEARCRFRLGWSQPMQA